MKLKKASLKKKKLVGVICAGLRSKLESFDKILAETNCSIFFLQETKLRRQGAIKTPNSQNFAIFELIRKQKTGGGLAIGVVKELKPTWISEGNDEVEFFTVQINLEGFSIRCVNGYGKIFGLV